MAAVREIVCGDAERVLAKLPAAAVDCVVTSPPYYRQRDYRGSATQVGRETSAADYVARLTRIFAEIRRVLKDTGTAWVVLGDKIDAGRQLAMPWRTAIALMDNGWQLRSEIVWHKPNAMPSPAKNRPTCDHETIFLLTKTDAYYYDVDAIREPHVTFSPESKMRGGRRHFGVRHGTPEAGKNGGRQNMHDGRWDQAFHPLGRNKRTVWSIPLSKYRGAHFAVFPEKLVETCILAGCPAGGLVLDPFLGSGTTAVVAKRLGRRVLGIDCVRAYCDLARERLTKETPSPRRRSDVRT